MTCKQLLLGYYIRTMTGTFTQIVFSFQICLRKGLDIYKCFKWKTNTWACKQLLLGLSVRDYDWTFHLGSLFLSIYCEKETHLDFWRKMKYLWLTSDYYLGLILEAMDEPFTQEAFILSLLFEMVKVWINHFEFDYEKGLILDQTFICICWWNKLEMILKWFDLGKYLTLDQAYFCSFFWKWFFLRYLWLILN